MERLLTIKDIAEKFQVSIWTVYIWTSKKYKNIPFYKIGGIVRFSPIKIERWMEQQEVKKQPPPKFPGVDNENEAKLIFEK